MGYSNRSGKICLITVISCLPMGSEPWQMYQSTQRLDHHCILEMHSTAAVKWHAACGGVLSGKIILNPSF